MTSVEGYARPAVRWRVGIGAAVVIVILALAVTVGIGILRGSGSPTESVVVDDAPIAADTTAELYVHVFGAVADPGLYVLQDGARVVDVVAAAGGLIEGADEGSVNLARPVVDGEQLYVPTVTESAAAPASGQGPDGAAPAGDGRVNLNTATEAELDTLPRIGPAMAGRIIQWRDANGRFTSIEDLLAVPGIGDKMLESLRELVTV